MSFPLFFTEIFPEQGGIIQLSEDTARHISGVLRMKAGEKIRLATGNGNIATAAILDSSKRSCAVKIESVENFNKPDFQLCIAVSLLKNPSRFEWMLEKCAELGVDQIQPLLCKRTEKQQFKKSRSESILRSAMLQSQQHWLTTLPEPISFTQFIEAAGKLYQKKFIAHCEPDNKTMLTEMLHSIASTDEVMMLIGPEGDFTPDEINLAIENGFEPVALGDFRLRTETAAVVAASLITATFWQS